MDPAPILRIDGQVERSLALTFDDLLAIPAEDHVEDVSRFRPTRRGDGVRLTALLRLARPTDQARYLTLHADRDNFHVSVGRQAVEEEGIIVFRDGDRPLRPDQGGPFRFLIKDPAACHTDELDDCANVKFLDRIELTDRRGLDTRPADEAAHQALHDREPAKD